MSLVSVGRVVTAGSVECKDCSQSVRIIASVRVIVSVRVCRCMYGCIYL